MKLKFNKQTQLILKRSILGIFLIIVLLFIVYDNTKQEKLDFNNLYAEVEEILNEEPSKTNSFKDDMLFYKPKGYKFINETYIMSKNDSYIEIIPEKISTKSETYTINKDKELVFTKEYTKGNGISMFVWNENKRYEVLIKKEDGYAVTGNFNRKNIKSGIIDMANILSTLKVKEIN